jgi:glycosyltransferase involved in cell wall biosynthesis
MKEKVKSSIAGVTGWVEAHRYQAYDPGDGNTSFLRGLTFNSIFLERLLTAVVLRVPFNIRPWIGIKPQTSTKGMGYMAWGYVSMYALSGENRYREQAIFCLDWLIRNRASGWADYCWGNHFAFVTRNGRLPAFEPTIVWSGLIGLAFLKAYEVFERDEYLKVASSVCDWVLKLPREQTDSGACLSYVPFRQSSIHNSNMLGAGLLASVAKYTNNVQARQTAREAMTYSCTRQRPDGAWYYGEAAKNRWIDNFHTGYNLDSLKRYIESGGDRSFEPQLLRGFDYFRSHFFEPDGRPKYFHDQTYPIDIQCASQAIDTLAFFSDSDGKSLDLACRVADWTIKNLQDVDGHFYYRDLGWKKIKTPMLHWGQGTMFKALAHLLSKLENKERRMTPDRQGEVVLPLQNSEIADAGNLRYVLITAARNEEAFLENTIKSVVAQTRKPLRWVIVSDGSTDRTDDIVKSYTRQHDWIELVRMPERRDRQFAAKAHCFNAGYERVKNLHFELVGNLDADITFSPDYYEFLIGKFAQMPELGVAGTPFVEDFDRPEKHTYAHPLANLEHVSGACQIFRKECFEAVGGYVPIKGGGIDWLAVTTARMKGWKTRTFIEKICFHHRKMGTAGRSLLMARFRHGQEDYYVGGHPLWQVFRASFQMREKPYILGGLFLFAGYSWALIKRMPRPVAAEFVAFHRAEQMTRLRKMLLPSSREESGNLKAVNQRDQVTRVIPQTSIAQVSALTFRGCSEQTPKSISTTAGDLQIRVTGRLFRIARVLAEGYEFVDDPETFVKHLKQSGLQADMFTFLQRIPDTEPKYTGYYLDREALAVLPIDTYEKWWKFQLKDKTRNMVRKAQKKGVDIRSAEFGSKFVEGIVAIYNECRVRQGKPFKHFGKDFETAWNDNISFSDRSEFIGAYYGEELIGFAKLVYQGEFASLMQIISKISHRDKAPTNGLIAKAVERCAESGISYLQYGSWSRGSIGDFKVHHGFGRFAIPRYYAPLNTKGRMMLVLGCQRSLRDRLPESTLDYVAKLRAKWYGFRYPYQKS